MSHQLYFHLSFLLIIQNFINFKLTKTKKKLVLINQENNEVSLPLKQKINKYINKKLNLHLFLNKNHLVIIIIIIIIM